MNSEQHKILINRWEEEQTFRMVLFELISPTICSTVFPLPHPATITMATIAEAKAPRIDIEFPIKATINSFSKKKDSASKNAESELT